MYSDIDPLMTMNTFVPFCSQHEKSLLRISWPFERLHFPETTVKQQSQQFETLAYPIQEKNNDSISLLLIEPTKKLIQISSSSSSSLP